MISGPIPAGSPSVIAISGLAFFIHPILRSPGPKRDEGWRDEKSGAWTVARGPWILHSAFCILRPAFPRGLVPPRPNGYAPGMRACVQRVRWARVTVAGEVIGQIGPGMLVLLGVAHEDTPECARQLAGKLAGLRIFADAEGKMNLSLAETGGAMLVVSQFTLLGDCRKGAVPVSATPPRPSWPNRSTAGSWRRSPDWGSPWPRAGSASTWKWSCSTTAP